MSTSLLRTVVFVLFKEAYFYAGWLPVTSRCASRGQIVAQPEALLRDVYDWGGTSFDHRRLLGNLRRLLSTFALSAQLSPPPWDWDLLNEFYDPNAPSRGEIYTLFVLIYMAMADTGIALGLVDLYLVAIPIPPEENKAAAPVGIALFPLLTGQAQVPHIQISDGVEINLAGGFESKIIRAEIRPGSTSVRVSTGDTSLSALAILSAQPASPWILLGTANSSRVELAKAHVSLSANGPIDEVNYKIEVGADNASLVLDFGEGDGFLQSVLGGKPQKLNLSTVVSWSNRTGFGFNGQAKLEANIPVHLSIAGDVLTVNTLYIALRAGGGNKAALQVALSGDLKIGPVTISVDRVGLRLELTSRSRTEPPGNLGNLDLGFGFKQPEGLGILIDAGAIVGGGYIDYDPIRKAYSGELELKLGTVEVKAIGVLETKLPDGSPGFSFLIFISPEFPPIELGMGFTLNAVGGLIGINRTMQLDVLHAGFKNQTLDSVLLPEDPIGNAPQIISNLQTIFPPQEGRYVFGPIVEIGWGTPTLITGRLGILLELPAPVRLAILGQITAILPSQKAALIVFHMDVLGTIDTEKQSLAIDATLYDSRILLFSLLGDMALRLSWSDQPTFALAIGGMHPRYQPPAGFPTLRRLQVSVTYGDAVHLSLTSYLAITSNTVQFGARLDARLSAAGFKLHGYFGFDTLFTFDPFSFMAEMEAGVELSWEGFTLMSLRLHLFLSGPNPWHARGTASFDILWWTISVHFDKIFGETTPLSMAPVDVLTPLIAALKDVHNWSAALPEGAERAVSLVAAKTEEGTLLAHPMGTLTVRQKVVPLGIPITRYGNSVLAEADQFDILDKVTFQQEGDRSAEKLAVPVTDPFAPAQFFEMSDAEKLDAPSYQQLQSGVTIEALDGQNMQVPDPVTLQLEYDTFFVEDLERTALSADRFRLLAGLLPALTQQGAAAQSLVRATGTAKYAVPGIPKAVTIGESKYAIASTLDLTVASHLTVPKEGRGYFEASRTLKSYLAAHPEQRGLWHSLPEYEAVQR